MHRTAEKPAAPPLLGPDDPPPFERVHPDGAARAVIACDHASNRTPKALGDLGAVAAAMERHIAYDIGAAGLARRLAALIDAPAVLSNYSRLVIDINRPPDDFTSIREIYDGTVIAGNRNLTPADRAQRVARLFRPYHDALADMLAAKRRETPHPAVISVHSCTDVYKGARRPWHVGVLSNRDRRMAERVMADLARVDPALTIGDNKPYSGLDSFGYTIETHALPAGLPNVLFEVRQDLIRTEEGQVRFAEILAEALRPALADDALFTPYRG